MKDIASLVPQIFYDLIGRVVPGALVLLLGALLFVEPSAAAQFWRTPAPVPTTVLVFVALLLAYSVGTILGAIAFAILNWEWTTRSVSSITAEIPSDFNAKDLTRGQIAFMYDALQLYNPAAGARLVKLRAEQHMAAVLVAGVMVLAVAGILVERPASTSISPAVLFTGLAVLAGGGYVFYVHLAIRGRRLLMNCCQLLSELQEITTSAPACHAR